MKRGVLVVVLSLHCLTNASKSNEYNVVKRNISLQLNETYDFEKPKVYTKIIDIPEKTNTTIQIIDVPDKVSFLIGQIHSHLHNITLSYDPFEVRQDPRRSIQGTNVGLYYNIEKNPAQQMYVSNEKNVTLLIAVVAYNSRAPIPGGCNMEFSIETSPFQLIYLKGMSINVDIQPASKPKINNKDVSCQPTKSFIRHDMYMLYTPSKDYSPESYFAAIQKLLTPEDIEKNALKMPVSLLGPTMRRVYSAYYGIGSAYGVVAVFENQSSAYVPAFSYACDPLSQTNSCEVLYTVSAEMICVCVFIGGVLATFSRSIKTKMFATTTFAGSIIGFIICYSAGMEVENIGLAAIGFGLIFAILWWLTWVYFGIPSMLTLICHVTFGFLCSCILYCCYPDGTNFKEINFYFWTIFVTLTILIGEGFAVIPHFGIRFCCSVLCALLVILSIDYYSSSSLKYIFINIIRRIINPKFSAAIINIPHQLTDILLLISWILMSLISYLRCM